MTKQTMRDLASAADALHLVLVDDEREEIFTASARSAIRNAREVLRAILLRELRPEAIKETTE